MEYAIAVYLSRNVTMQAYNALIRRGVNVVIVSTPKFAGAGCGLSLKMSAESARQYRNLLSSGESFAGIFLVRRTARGSVAIKI